MGAQIRTINLVGAMHEMRASRIQTPVTEYRNPDGSFHFANILKEACRQARRFRAGLSWQQRVSMTLRGVWESARRQGSKPYSPAQAAFRTRSVGV